MSYPGDLLDDRAFELANRAHPEQVVTAGWYPFPRDDDDPDGPCWAATLVDGSRVSGPFTTTDQQEGLTMARAHPEWPAQVDVEEGCDDRDCTTCYIPFEPTADQIYKLMADTAAVVDKTFVLGVRPHNGSWFANCDGVEVDGTPAEAVRGVVDELTRNADWQRHLLRARATAAEIKAASLLDLTERAPSD